MIIFKVAENLAMKLGRDYKKEEQGKITLGKTDLFTQNTCKDSFSFLNAGLLLIYYT